MTMNQTTIVSRRHLLKLSASLAALGLAGMSTRPCNSSHRLQGVGVHLFNGNDGNNLSWRIRYSR